MMNHERPQAWLSQLEQLGIAQRREAEALLSAGSLHVLDLQQFTTRF